MKERTAMPELTKSTAGQKASKTARKAPPVVAEAESVVAPKTTRAASKTRKVREPVAAISSSEGRHRLIAEAAYYLAEKRGFQGGNPEQDWLEAAAQVDRMFMN
jgi:hypothetical protein